IALADVEVNSLQVAITARLSVQPFPFIDAGQRVRINAGALAGVEGIIIGCKQRLRLVLSVTLLPRSGLVEIDRDQVSVEECQALSESCLSTSSGVTRLDLVQGD